MKFFVGRLDFFRSNLALRLGLVLSLAILPLGLVSAYLNVRMLIVTEN